MSHKRKIGTNWAGTQVTIMKRRVLATYGNVCHLCGQPGANTVDHLIPKSERPDLAFEISNLRPAHLSCNSGRGTRALVPREAAKGWC